MNAVEDARAEIERWKDRPTITRRSHMDQIVGIERLRDLLAALSSPPADDVREALAKAIADGQAHPLLPRPAQVAPFLRDYRAADHVLTVFEVRLRGTVTDTEEELSRLEQIAEKVAASRGTVTEPTDAEVNAAIKSLWDNGYVFQITVGGMRTALKAAAEARS